MHIEVLHEELAMALSLHVDTWGETVIALINVTACATDSAPSMMGRYSGFMAFPKAASFNVLTIYCDIHWGHLVTKNMSGCFNLSLKTIIKTVNEIKALALNTRLFTQLCNENDEAFKRLLLHAEVRRLS